MHGRYGLVPVVRVEDQRWSAIGAEFMRTVCAMRDIDMLAYDIAALRKEIRHVRMLQVAHASHKGQRRRRAPARKEAA